MLYFLITAGLLDLCFAGGSSSDLFRNQRIVLNDGSTGSGIGTCRRDSNCAGNRICIAGYCRRVSHTAFSDGIGGASGAKPCLQSSDCRGGQICHKRECIKEPGLFAQILGMNTDTRIDDQCVFNSDCPGNQLCYLGRCFTRAQLANKNNPLSPSCRNNNECAANFICEKRECIRVHSFITGESDELGAIIGGLRKDCLVRTDCGPKERCFKGVCVSKKSEKEKESFSSEKNQCKRDKDCGDVFICNRGDCVAPECLEHEDCRSGEKCRKGKCAKGGLGGGGLLQGLGLFSQLLG